MRTCCSAEIDTRSSRRAPWGSPWARRTWISFWFSRCCRRYRGRSTSAASARPGASTADRAPAPAPRAAVLFGATVPCPGPGCLWCGAGSTRRRPGVCGPGAGVHHRPRRRGRRTRNHLARANSAGTARPSIASVIHSDSGSMSSGMFIENFQAISQHRVKFFLHPLPSITLD